MAQPQFGTRVVEWRPRHCGDCHLICHRCLELYACLRGDTFPPGKRKRLLEHFTVLASGTGHSPADRPNLERLRQAVAWLESPESLADPPKRRRRRPASS